MTSSYKAFDLLSFQLGMAAAFCEMVQQGVKKLALSPPIDQKALPQLEKALYEVAGHYGVSVWIESAFSPPSWPGRRIWKARPWLSFIVMSRC